MKKILMLLILPVFLVSCGEPDAPPKFEKHDAVVLIKDCIGSVLLKKGTTGVIKYSNSTRSKIITEEDGYWLDNSCMESQTNVENEKLIKELYGTGSQPTKKPAVSKYETIQEYVQFKQFCEKYGKLFKQNFEVDVTENDELTCAGKNRKQLEYDIELIEQYKGVK